jgi:translation initiation factor eIF-2B subunit epsilon
MDGDLLQAVVLADSFDTKFYPITLEMPRVCIVCEELLQIAPSNYSGGVVTAAAGERAHHRLHSRVPRWSRRTGDLHSLLLESAANTGLHQVESIFVVFFLVSLLFTLITLLCSQSRWTETPNVVIRTIASTRCLSTGDALREIYNLQIISSDFVLVSGDVISNMKLQPVLQAHRSLPTSSFPSSFSPQLSFSP